MNHSEGSPMKMIDFINQLYKKYRVLTKLNPNESDDFQTQIIQLLIDQHQNIEETSYQTVVNQIGLPNFVLQILGNVINHQSSIQRSKIVTPTHEDLQQKISQLNKKIKVIQRKQLRVNKLESQLCVRIKQHCQKMQKSTMMKLNTRQAQIKKVVNGLFYQLRSREKIMVQKIEQIGRLKKMACQNDEREKMIDQKIKNVQRREKEIKLKEQCEILANKENELSNYKKQNQQLKNEIRQLVKKIKNTDMAYKKLKNQISLKDQQMILLKNSSKQTVASLEDLKDQKHTKEQKHNKQQKHTRQQKHTKEQQHNKQQQHTNQQQHSKQKNINKDINLNKNIDLNKLDISIIENCQMTQEEQQEIVQFLKEQQNTKKHLEDFTSIIESLLLQMKQHNLQISQQTYNLCRKYKLQVNMNITQKNTQTAFDQFSTSKLDRQQYIFSQIKITDDNSKIKFIHSNQLMELVLKCIHNKFNRDNVIYILQLMIQLISEGTHYQTIIKYLSAHTFSNFLQQAYLRFQMNQYIAEITTLLLSRFILTHQPFTVISHFSKAISIRYRMGLKQGILYSNIKHICSNI